MSGWKRVFRVVVVFFIDVEYVKEVYSHEFQDIGSSWLFASYYTYTVYSACCLLSVSFRFLLPRRVALLHGFL